MEDSPPKSGKLPTPPSWSSLTSSLPVLHLDRESAPEQSLGRLKGSALLVNIQNAKYYKNLALLCNDQWDYHGLPFAAGQKHHFTIGALKQAANQAGFSMVSIQEIWRESEDQDDEQKPEIIFGRLHLRRSDYNQGDWHDFFVYDYQVLLEPTPTEISPCVQESETTVLLEQIEAWIKSGTYDRAMQSLIKIIEREPANWRALNAMGLAAWYKDAVGDALLWFSKALERQPCDSDLLMNFADSGLAMGRIEEVLRALDRALALEPGLREIKILADKIRLEQRYGLCSSSFNRVITSREMNLAGENLIREGMLDKAESMFREILAVDDRDFVAHNNLGLIYWYRPAISQAFACFERSLEINPVFEDALVNLFDAALTLKKVSDILPRVQRALDLDPGLREARLIAAEIKKQGDAIYQIPHFEKIAGNDLLVKQGFKLLDELKIDEAILKFLDALEQDSCCARSYNGLGMAAYYKGMLNEAFAFFNRSLDLSPINEDVLLNLYDTETALGTYAISRKRMENALKVATGLLKVAETLNSLEKERP